MALVCHLFIIAWSSPATAVEAELWPRYFEALRMRGLHRLAEEYAATQLASPDLTSRERTVLLIESARTFVDHGMLQADDQRTELWNEARRLLQSSTATEISPTDRLQIESWSNLLTATEGNALAFMAVLQPEMELLQAQAVDVLRPAVRRLKEMGVRLETKRSATEELSAGQLRQLRQQIDLMCGESLLWLAQLESSPAERSALLLDADKSLEKVDRGREPSSNVTAPASIPPWRRKTAVLQARVARLQGEVRRAEKRLDQSTVGEPDPLDRDQTLAERIRLELGRNRIDVALQLVVDRIRLSSTSSDELRATCVQALLRAAEFAEQKGDAVTQQQALAEAQRQADQTAGIWRMQAAILMERSRQTRELGPELARVVREALAAWHAGKIDQAIDRYGKAATLAFQTQHPDQAFEYALTRASILLQEKRWRTAETALGELMQNFPDHSRVAEADLLRCYAIGQRAPQSAEFQSALQQHVARFLQSPTRGDAFWMLGTTAEQQQQRLAESIGFYRQVPADNPRKEEADLRITILIEQLLHLPRNLAEERDRNETLITTEIRRIVPPLLTVENQLTTLQCRILLQSVRLCLQHRTPLLAEADRILNTVQRRIENEKQISLTQQLQFSPEWAALQQTALQLRILVLASQQKLMEARGVLQQLGRTDPEALLSILASLTDLTARIDLAQQQELGTLQRMTVEEIAAQRNQLTPEQVLLLDRAAIQASIALRDWPEAIHTLEGLIVTQPNDPDLRHQLIDVSLRQGTSADLNRAKDQWIRLEQLEPKGTPRWIEARISIAELLIRLGDTAGAKKILGVTRTLYPQLGSPELKQRGDAAWQKLP